MNGDLIVVEASKKFRNKIQRKADSYGQKSRLMNKIKIDRRVIRRVIDTGKITRGKLATLVKYFEGEDARVEDFIKEA